MVQTSILTKSRALSDLVNYVEAVKFSSFDAERKFWEMSSFEETKVTHFLRKDLSTNIPFEILEEILFYWIRKSFVGKNLNIPYIVTTAFQTSFSALIRQIWVGFILRERDFYHPTWVSSIYKAFNF